MTVITTKRPRLWRDAYMNGFRRFKFLRSRIGDYLDFNTSSSGENPYLGVGTALIAVIKNKQKKLKQINHKIKGKKTTKIKQKN